MADTCLQAVGGDSKSPPSLTDALRRRAQPPSLVEYRLKEIQLQLGDLSEDEQVARKQHDIGFLLCTAAPSGMISLVIHLSLLIALGLYMLTPRYSGAEAISMEVVMVEEEAEEELPVVEILADVAVDLEPLPDVTLPEPSLDELLGDDEGVDEFDQLVPHDLAALLRAVGEEVTVGSMQLTSGLEEGTGVGELPADGGLAIRDFRRRQALSYGATQESENAVELALEWLARHQCPDGSWSFDHRHAPRECPDCRCGNPGAETACIGATAMALLPFFGAGRTHLHGEYRRQVAEGLRFLLQQQGQDGSLIDGYGRMYSHGLATLALCEAYAMARYQFPSAASDPVSGSVASDARTGRAGGGSSGDRGEIVWTAWDDKTAADLLRPVGSDGVPRIRLDELAAAAQLAIHFIEAAQHKGGGWRYSPGQAGDTSVVGWQMMALKSGYLAGLDVQPATIRQAVKFLDSVQQRRGLGYGYTGPGDGPATSAIGLLCRMFTGWDRDHRGLTAGVKRMGPLARPQMGLYFYYYATQVMHHYGGEPWSKWNRWMRDYLVVTQDRDGSEAGSWILNGANDSAGRLYCTAMATMTLEVYYRYSPIYGDRAVRSESEPVTTAGTSDASGKLNP